MLSWKFNPTKTDSDWVRRESLGPGSEPPGISTAGGSGDVAVVGGRGDQGPRGRSFFVELADQAQGEEGAHVLEVRAHRQVDLVPAGAAGHVQELWNRG